MAGIDKAAIVFSIAIALIGVGIAVIGDSSDYSLAVTTPTVSTPTASSETSESKAGTDPFADLAQKVRDEAEEEVMEEAHEEEEAVMEEEVMEEAHEEEEAVMEEEVMEEAHEEEEAVMEEEVMEEAHEEEEAVMEEEVMEEAHEEEEAVMEEEVMEAESAGPQTHVVEIPAGTAVPGCEETSSCYLPAEITINVGDTIEWVNVDTAAHTVSSGSPSEGPTFDFDSSLIRADASFEFTFEEAGTYDYYCMVHPWMLGSVSVN